jgi:hypothetical protein
LTFERKPARDGSKRIGSRPAIELRFGPRAAFFVVACYSSLTLSPLVELLQPTDSIHLTDAQGWPELGNHEEAFEELWRSGQKKKTT